MIEILKRFFTYAASDDSGSVDSSRIHDIRISTCALLLEMTTASKHIITIENPIEYHFKTLQSFIRQREVGRDTPSFALGLPDALRELKQ